MYKKYIEQLVSAEYPESKDHTRMTDVVDLEAVMKKLFEKEKVREDKFLTVDDLTTLLEEEAGRDDVSRVRKGILGYPSHPLYRQLACMITEWMELGHCPVLDLPSYDLLDEQAYVESRASVINSISPLLEGLKTLHSLWSEDEVIFRLREILVLLEKRGLLDLLGIRKTVGTKDLWPPARRKLLDSFTAKHSEKAQLTVGARALAKHHHRDQSDSWWGNSKGSEQDKNDHALTVVNRILDNATWINIHWLPQEVFVMEARVLEGYGVRWTADGSQFRGFLEPQMVGGHEVGWKH
ncbi:uncharacterized protein LOC128218580 [Mya arenaria]|uniref:uncharacterized protein LOC128218580 n=1 Tax=Mya arenaria TaxID=6604 RepID=UPI0022E580E2|nr:uncharacterized protein LOC128218580 [Mya arenaria]